MKAQLIFKACLTFFLWSEAVSAGFTVNAGAHTILTPTGGDAVDRSDASTPASDTDFFIFTEKTGFTLGSNVVVDFLNPPDGLYSMPGDEIPGVIPSGTVVNSYVIYVLNIFSPSNTVFSGTVTFNGETIIGMSRFGATHDDPSHDQLEIAGVSYDMSRFDFEMTGGSELDDFVLSSSSSIISFDAEALGGFGPQGQMDALRIITVSSGACGDSIIDSGEQCDDGNTVNGDGCSSTCQNEVCGNGIIDPGEGCDDGGTVNGDGCDSSCQLEPGAINVDLEIQPGLDPNCVKINDIGVVRVAVLGSGVLDVSTIDTSTLIFAGLSPEPGPDCAIADVAGPGGTSADGQPDLLCRFTDDSGLFSAPGKVGTLTGMLIGGFTSITGSGTICELP